MDLIYVSFLICLLLEACISKRKYHGHGYWRSLGTQHSDNVQHYDSSRSYGNEPQGLRGHWKKQNSHYRHRMDSACSESEHYKNNYECKCSCSKCKTPKSCCIDYCTMQCAMPSNIIMVPYPVPFMVHPPSHPPIQSTTTAPSTATITTTPSTTESTEPPTTTPATTTSTSPPLEIPMRYYFTKRKPDPRKTRHSLRDLHSTSPYFLNVNDVRRFRIVPDKKVRRNMGVSNRPSKYEELPKYGIVPIPEKIALKLMHQLRNEQKNDQIHLDRNAMDYAD